MYHAGGVRQSWRRVLGLSSRAVSVTTQRLMDVMAIYQSYSGSDKTDGTVLAVGMVITTLAMAFTMARHSSALRRYRPHGRRIAICTSVLQVAPVYEMIDKVLSHGPPRGFGGIPLAGDTSEPLLRTTAPKGSPGENAMRGVRKMSIVNVPQAILSLWWHIGQLFFEGLQVPANPRRVSIAFAAAFLSLGLGIADFVLYVWVDDAFLRMNKKLVTLHYLIEIIARLPTVVLFHLIFRELHGYKPTLALFFADVLVTSLLLLIARFKQRSHGCSCLLGLRPRQCLTQFLFSAFISVILFFVNIVFFDPGMSFFYVNQVYYVLKYVELGVMWSLIYFVRLQGGEPTHGWAAVLRLPVPWYRTACVASVTFAFLNACFVWGLVPARRREKDRRLVGADVSWRARGSSADNISWRARADPVEVAVTADPPSFSRAVSSKCAGRDATLLDHLGETMELLKLLSFASRSRNRATLLGVIVDELWIRALPWSGTFEGGAEGCLELVVDGRRKTVEFRSRRETETVVVYTGNLIDGTLVVPTGRSGVRRGSFDGCRIVWDDGRVWEKRRSGPSEPWAQEQAVANDDVLRLILPQLALALRWDSTSARSSSHNPRPRDGGASGRDAVAANDFGDRPLLRFLIRYAIGTRQADIISDLYWALVCLSHEQGSFSPDFGYRSARLALLRALQGKVEGLDCAVQGEELHNFLQAARRLVRSQQEVWRQTEELINKHSGRSDGGGAWIHRTETLRNALRRWPELREKAANRCMDSDWEMLQSPTDDHASSRQLSSPWKSRPGSPHIDIVSPSDTLITLPIDPNLQFRGMVIEESEVVASKQAPLILTWRRAAADSERSPTMGAEMNEDDEVRERYLLKVGDDLRQDQLMLQMMKLMQCVWLENLAAEDAAQLSLANFKVLAITPESGYVKFVEDAMPLSEALHIGHGSLTKWLEENMLPELNMDDVMDTFCGSVAACCVVTYVLGVGDRHLENLCVTKRGQLFHVDFGFVLGDDPKPMAPPVRLPQQVAQALLETNRLERCFVLARRAYLALRPFATLWTSILELAAATGDGAGCKKLAHEPLAAVSGVRERLRVAEQDDERAAGEFLSLMRESSQQLSSILLDKVHAAGLFWR